MDLVSSKTTQAIRWLEYIPTYKTYFADFIIW